jgi:eukaryotic-like serine/threonine-protein kinase
MPKASLPPAGRSQLAGRYRLDTWIAAGGVGEVWRGFDAVLDRPVAVKLLRDEHVLDPQTRARFRAEAKHAGALSHPGIAQVYDYGEESPRDRPYLVMELVDGPSLAAVLADGPLDPARTMDVVAQTAAGLQAAHEAGLVHRDIKPANLLLGPGGQVKITDFGIAYAAGSAPLTRTGLLVGTPAYLAPERACGASATSASDLYSLGIVAWECLAGHAPFIGLPLEVATAHRDCPLPPLPSSVPPPVASLVNALTRKEPGERPADAGAVAERAGRMRDALINGTELEDDDGTRDALTGWAPRNGPLGRYAAQNAAADLSTGRGAGHARGGYPLLAAPTVAPTGAATPPPAAAPPPRIARPQPPPSRSATTALPEPPPLPPASSTYDLSTPGRRTPGRRAPRPLVLLAGAIGVLIVAAALVGWLLSGNHGNHGNHGATDSPTVTPKPTQTLTHSQTGAGMVEVRAALVGLPVRTVAGDLRGLGLRVHVTWQPTFAQRPGTVLFVQPTGLVRPDRLIQVIAARSPHGHHRRGRGLANGG